MTNPSATPSLQAARPAGFPTKNARAEAESTGSSHRRHVTLLFSDVAGSSAHAERLEEEVYAKSLTDFRAIAREVIAKHGGNIARIQGDGLLAIFGHPTASEDDGRRATEAALELHDRVRLLMLGSDTMQLHSGIHAGLVLLTDGDIERGRLDVVGEVPNTAARLCSLAAAGEVMVSEETLGPQTLFFQVAQLRQLVIKGRSAPLNVVRVLGRASMGRRIDAAAQRGVVSFVGRLPALAQMAAAAEQARTGTATRLLVIGEAGIGKTRLMDEFQSRLDPATFRVLQGYCENYLGAEPLQPFMHWIRSALGWRADASAQDNESATQTALASLGEAAINDFEPLAQAMAGGHSASGSSPQAPVRVSAITELLARLAQQRTLVLILDDWQWADDASRHVLEALNARCLPVFVLIATRPVDDENHGLIGIRTLGLQPLAFEEGAHAISAWLPSAEPFITQEIYRLSGGSPLFIEELCRAAADGDFPSASRNSAAWINALVASRMARLPAEQVDFLQTAAVGGNVFAVWLLERLVGPVRADEMLEALAEQDFLVPADQPGMLRFKHVLTRDAVYATVNPARRRALHLQVAQVVHAASASQYMSERLETLAYHYDAANASEQAADFAEAAGDKALATMALDRARSHYTTALKSLDASPTLNHAAKLRWCAVAEKLGQACVFDPLDISHGLTLFECAARRAAETGDANALARAHYWLGYVNYGKGRPREAVRHCESALSHAQAAGDARLAAQVQATLGQSLASAGRYAQAMPLLEQAYESKRQQIRTGSGTAIGSAYTLARMAYTWGDLGRFEEAGQHFEKALHLLGDKIHPVGASIRELVCAVHLWQGRWDEACQAGLDGADMALRCRSQFNTAMGRALAACGSWARDRDAVSFRQLSDATNWIEMRGGAISTSLNYGWLVEASLSLGLAQEARLHAARLFTRARMQDRHGQAQGCRALAKMFASQGQVARAHHYLAVAQNAADIRGSPRESALNTFAHAEVLAGLKQPRRALELAEKAAETFETMKMIWHVDRCAEFAARVVS